jgi:hypothetical protein
MLFSLRLSVTRYCSVVRNNKLVVFHSEWRHSEAVQPDTQRNPGLHAGDGEGTQPLSLSQL